MRTALLATTLLSTIYERELGGFEYNLRWLDICNTLCNRVSKVRTTRVALCFSIGIAFFARLVHGGR